MRECTREWYISYIPHNHKLKRQSNIKIHIIHCNNHAAQKNTSGKFRGTKLPTKNAALTSLVSENGQLPWRAASHGDNQIITQARATINEITMTKEQTKTCNNVRCANAQKNDTYHTYRKTSNLNDNQMTSVRGSGTKQEMRTKAKHETHEKWYDRILRR